MGEFWGILGIFWVNFGDFFAEEFSGLLEFAFFWGGGGIFLGNFFLGGIFLGKFFWRNFWDFFCADFF